MVNNIFKELKENKYTVFVFIVFLLLFIVGWVLFGLVMPKKGEPVYGNRLEGIEEVRITSSQTDKLIETLEKYSYVTSASTDIKGKIVNVIITVKEGTEVKKAKELGGDILKAFEDDQKKFYDFQIFVKNEKEDSSGYPVIGYKNSKDSSFTF